MRPSKQRKFDDSVKSQKRSPVNITLSRVPLFYARPNLVPRTSVISVCLPKKHILNQINPSGPKPKTDPEKAKDPGPQPQLEGARNFVQYVFPRQHGLPNPFTVSTENAVPFYNREIEAAILTKGLIETPRRVENALGFFEKLIWRHGKCGYKPLLNTACPSKVKGNVQKSDILEYMSEGSLQLVTQPNIPSDSTTYSDGQTLVGCESTQEKKEAANKPRFVDFACSHSEVNRYAILVTEEVIPKVLWGGKENFEVIKRCRLRSCRPLAPF
ncbi:hypothetical protein BJ322DRAFT_467552 [Thelephora terrestris]|uniref:Telomerase reverse transcriptase n=1 Tax=Thelephora terrestris TaxID=56493 RepID=A0A9P6L1X3_9AGAM|nr:hypothetical protein BJ322DRAFT_467552 [Thelephora terrestris]